MNTKVHLHTETLDFGIDISRDQFLSSMYSDVCLTTFHRHKSHLDGKIFEAFSSFENTSTGVS